MAADKQWHGFKSLPCRSGLQLSSKAGTCGDKKLNFRDRRPKPIRASMPGTVRPFTKRTTAFIMCARHGNAARNCLQKMKPTGSRRRIATSRDFTTANQATACHVLERPALAGSASKVVRPTVENEEKTHRSSQKLLLSKKACQLGLT